MSVISGKVIASVFGDVTFWTSLISVLLSVVLLFWFLKEKGDEEENVPPKKEKGVVKVNVIRKSK